MVKEAPCGSVEENVSLAMCPTPNTLRHAHTITTSDVILPIRLIAGHNINKNRAPLSLMIGSIHSLTIRSARVHWITNSNAKGHSKRAFYHGMSKSNTPSVIFLLNDIFIVQK